MQDECSSSSLHCNIKEVNNEYFPTVDRTLEDELTSSLSSTTEEKTTTTTTTTTKTEENEDADTGNQSMISSVLKMIFPKSLPDGGADFIDPSESEGMDQSGISSSKFPTLPPQPPKPPLLSLCPPPPPPLPEPIPPPPSHGDSKLVKSMSDNEELKQQETSQYMGQSFYGNFMRSSVQISQPKSIETPRLTPEETVEVNQSFLKIINQSGLYNLTEDMVNSIPVAQKIQIVRNYPKQKNDQTFTKAVSAFLEIPDDSITVKELKSLDLILRTRNGTIEHFLSAENGLKKFFKILTHCNNNLTKKQNIEDVKFIRQIISCLKSICSVRIGVNRFIDSQNLLNHLILLLDSSDIHLKSDILTLFSIACAYTNDNLGDDVLYGFKSVLNTFKYFEHVKRERVSFVIVSTMAKYAHEQEFIESCIGLINSLLKFIKNDQEREEIEKQFMELGVNNIIHKMIMENSILEESLLRKIKEFQDLLSDKYDPSLDKLNDPAQLASLISAKLGIKNSSHLLSILQHLHIYATNYTDSLAENWETLGRVVFKCITSASNNNGTMIDISPNEIRMQDRLSAQQQKIDEYSEKERKQYNVIMKKLKNWKHMLANEENASGDTPPKVESQEEEDNDLEILKPLSDFVGDIKILSSNQIYEHKKEVNQLNKDIRTLQTKLSILKKKYGIPEDQDIEIPEEENKEEVNKHQSPTSSSSAAPPPPGPPPPPPPGPPPPPPPGSSGTPGTVPSLNLPQIPDWKKKKVKTKQLFWGDNNTIKNIKVKETIFIKAKVTEKTCKHSDKIEDFFGKIFSIDSSANKKEETVTVAAPKEHMLNISESRHRVMSIPLKSIKLDPDELRDAIIEMDHQILTQEKLSKLETALPTKEELSEIQNYKGDTSKLEFVSRLLYAIKDIPQLKERIKLWSFKYQFSSLKANIQCDIDNMIKATKELKDSSKFSSFLSIVLAVGNFLNSKQVWGFKLDALLVLKNTKTTDQKSNLLESIISFLMKNQNNDHDTDLNILRFYEELGTVERASRVEYKSLEQDIALIATGIMEIKDFFKIVDLKKEEKSTLKGDPFLEKMKRFLEDAEYQFNIITANQREMLNQCKELASLFGEDAEAMAKEPNKLFSSIVSFIHDYREALENLEEKEKRLSKQSTTTTTTTTNSSYGNSMDAKDAALSLLEKFRQIREATGSSTIEDDGSDFAD